MLNEIDHESGTLQATFETISAHKEGGVLFAEIAAPPMNLLGPELVRDLVSLIQQTEADDSTHVLVFKSADPEYFISHVDVTRISEYGELAAKLSGESSLDASIGDRYREVGIATGISRPSRGLNMAEAIGVYRD